MITTIMGTLRRAGIDLVCIFVTVSLWLTDLVLVGLIGLRRAARIACSLVRRPGADSLLSRPSVVVRLQPRAVAATLPLPRRRPHLTLAAAVWATVGGRRLLLRSVGPARAERQLRRDPNRLQRLLRVYPWRPPSLHPAVAPARPGAPAAAPAQQTAHGRGAHGAPHRAARAPARHGRGSTRAL